MWSVIEITFEYDDNELKPEPETTKECIMPKGNRKLKLMNRKLEMSTLNQTGLSDLGDS